MTQFLPIRGTTTQINNTPIVDGQVLFETNNSNGENHIYIDVGLERLPIGISDWEQVTDKPFETIGNNLTVVNNVLNADDQTWSQILNKPFSSIGSGLTVTNGVLSANVTTPSWSTIDNKPFTDIGVGLTVDSNNRLNADIRNIGLSTEGTSAQNTFRHQVFAINISGTSTSTEVNGTKYMQYQQTLDTVNNTVYTFSNSDITNNSAVDVFTDIWGIDPISVNIETGVCRVTFAPHDTANTSMTCRIYIK